MLTAAKIKEHPGNVIDWDGKISLTKSAIIYGRNASGKSNLLRAMVTLSEFIFNSINTQIGEKIAYYNPFKLDERWSRHPCTFEIDYIASDNIRYNYQVSYTSEEVLAESLYYYPKKQKAKLFIREKGKPIDFSISLRGDKKSVERQLLANQLFLSRGVNSNIKQLTQPFTGLVVLSLLFERDNGDDIVDRTIVRNVLDNRNKNYQSKIEKLVRLADVGISAIQLNAFSKEKGNSSVQQLPDEYKNYELNLRHKGSMRAGANEIDFTINDESAGTLRLLNVGNRVINILENGWTLIIDEFDRSLHPLLTKALINLFHNPKTNPKNAQLIFASHDVSLLDNELFRRDQIWFTEKETDGSTKVYSLSDFKGVRKEIPYDQWYMSGRFGAIPVINETELQSAF